MTVGEKRESKFPGSLGDLSLSQRELLTSPERAPLTQFESNLRNAPLTINSHTNAPPIFPIARLTDDGPDWGADPQPEDEIGYCMVPWRADYCLPAAIATVTQVAIEEVPDLELLPRKRAGEDPAAISDMAWTRVVGWADARGLVIRFWEEHELPVPRRRWIGVIKREGWFTDHCVIMSHARAIFDPMWSILPPPGTRHPTLDESAKRVSHGLTFDRKE